MTRFHEHRAFGLTIRSDRPIPGLPVRPFVGRPDVQVDLPGRPLPAASRRDLWYESPLDPGRQRLRVWHEPEAGDFEFAYTDGTRIRVDGGGTRVTVWWPAPLTLADATTYLLGPVMGLLLRLRGKVCLHASVVSVDGGAVGILAPAGHGKSTTAAAFALGGHPVLSDDVLVLDERRDEFRVLPAYPRLRLWPAAVEALFGSAEALPRISPSHPDWDKRYLDLSNEGFVFEERPLPLSGLYRGVRDAAADSPHLRELSGADALLVVVAGAYVSHLLDRRMRSRQFEVLGRLVERVPVVRFGIREGIDQLEALRRAVVDDCRRRRREPPRRAGSAEMHPARGAPRDGR